MTAPIHLLIYNNFHWNGVVFCMYMELNATELQNYIKYSEIQCPMHGIVTFMNREKRKEFKQRTINVQL